MRSYDFLIIGSGIVGLTVAFELKQRNPNLSITIIDKESCAGLHASGRNSGVLHSGVYYSSDSLKAKVCSLGAKKMTEFAKEYDINFSRSGKTIVATKEDDVRILEKLLNNAKENNIRASIIDDKDLHQIEPFAAHSYGAIYSPDTAVIDSLAVVNTLVKLLIEMGVTFHWDTELLKLTGNGEVLTSDGYFSYGYLFNCSGAYADLIAKQFDLAHDYALVPFKGIYWKLRPQAEHLVKANIYPVPDIKLPFLGVHLTKVISGDVYVGPTAIPALGRENYGLFSGIKVRESLNVARQLFAMYLNDNNNFRELSHVELGKYRKSNFLKAGQQLVPSLKYDDLIPTKKAGIRPQLINLKKKKLEMDFILEHSARSTHVLNAISPAFTSAFAFAAIIVDASGVV